MSEASILIVDDDPDISEAMKVVLENKGYNIEVALDGDEAMEKLAVSVPNLIILDVMMNTTREGFILSRDLKRDPKYRDIPILMLTAIKDKTGIDFKPAAGDEAWLPVEEFLDKPVRPEVLLEKVQALLS